MQRIVPNPNTHDLTNPNRRCPLCAGSANIHPRLDNPQILEGFCERCSNVRITIAATAEVNRSNEAYLISAWLRRRPDDEATLLLDAADIASILKDSPRYSVLEKLDLTLNQISSMTTEPGERSRFDTSRDFPLVHARSANEAAYYIQQLFSQGQLNWDTSTAQITAGGYKRLNELQRVSRQSAFVFVAMWFDPCMNQIYTEAIEPAISNAKYKPLRIDKLEHANRIDDEIIGRIRSSRFMVADFTGQRAGVYFEAGMMLGLGRTVIWMCDKKELSKVHFDTRQYNFIDYENTKDAQKRLYDRIIAIEGAGRN